MRTTLLVAASWLALGAAALAAEDACLTGASLLPDQRALAALRADTESACPCASFTERRLYRACARDVQSTAVEMGDLRLKCKRTASRINRGAVCGSGKIACGRFKPTARTPVSCRVKSLASCTDSQTVEASACTNETHCADVVEWTAATCVDVRDQGPFVPGARVVTYTKPSVLQYCTGGTGGCAAAPLGPGCSCNQDSDCQSGVCEIQNRALDTVIWYPAPPGSAPIDPGYGAVLNAPLDPSAGPYPLVLFSHGSCGYPLQSIFLTPLLASHGFVVAAPPHPGNTIFDFPNCNTIQARVASAVERPQDIMFVTDELLADDLDPGSFLFGAIDEARVGMSGHSFGGFTTYLVVQADPRFTVAVPLAAAVPGAPVVPVPSLTMLGQIDSVVDNTDIRTAYADAQPPKYLVEIQNAGHFAFSDGCFPGPDCNPPVTLTQTEAHAVVLRWVLPFLKRHLAGDAGYLPFFVEPVPPGVVFATEP